MPGTAHESHEMATLAALMQRVVGRDVAALEMLYDQLAGRIFGQVSRRLGGDGLAVEEAVEETFWQIWRQAPRLLDAEVGLPESLLQLARAAADETARRRSPAPEPAARDTAAAGAAPAEPSLAQPFTQPLNHTSRGQLA